MKDKTYRKALQERTQDAVKRLAKQRLEALENTSQEIVTFNLKKIDEAADSGRWAYTFEIKDTACGPVIKRIFEKEYGLTCVIESSLEEEDLDDKLTVSWEKGI